MQLKTIAMIIAYLVCCVSGWLAVVNYMRSPHMEKDFGGYSSGYHRTPGFDLSWYEVVVMGLFVLIPPATIAANFFWLWALRQHIKRRPLIKFPKCSVAIRAKKMS